MRAEATADLWCARAARLACGHLVCRARRPRATHFSHTYFSFSCCRIGVNPGVTSVRKVGRNKRILGYDPVKARPSQLYEKYSCIRPTSPLGCSCDETLRHFWRSAATCGALNFVVRFELQVRFLIPVNSFNQLFKLVYVWMR